MNRNRWSLAVAASLILTFVVTAQERGNMQNMTFTQRYGQQLNLTAAQTKLIDEMDAKFDKEHSEFIESYRKTAAEMREARQANDTAKMDALKPKYDSQRTEMMKLRGEHEGHIETVLTDAQKVEWNKIKAEREARMKERAQHQ